MPKAYPIYDSAYRGHLAAVRECLDRIANLHTVGRNGMHQCKSGALDTGFEYHEEQRIPT